MLPNTLIKLSVSGPNRKALRGDLIAILGMHSGFMERTPSTFQIHPINRHQFVALIQALFEVEARHSPDNRIQALKITCFPYMQFDLEHFDPLHVTGLDDRLLQS